MTDASICGATWPEDTNLLCLRPLGHRGTHFYEDPPIGYGTGGVIDPEDARRMSASIDANGCASEQHDDDGGWRDYDHGFRDGYQAALREGPDTLLQAARWVVKNWDRQATQHASMPALRRAVQRSVGDYQAPVIDQSDARSEGNSDA